MIRITVTPSKMVTGIDHLEDQGTLLTAYDLAHAMREEWAQDAHFFCYAPVGPKGDDAAALTSKSKWPRINKPCLPHIRKKGGDVKLNAIVFDYDINLNVDEQTLYDHGWDGNRRKLPKIKWTPTLLESWVEKMEHNKQVFLDKRIAWANYVYTTKHGARYIHVLDDGMPVDEAEAYIRGLSEQYRAAGVIMDPACDDWTRLFRLPKVMRDGDPTWTSPFFHLISQFEELLVLDGIDPVSKRTASEYAEIKELDIPLPNPDEAMGYIETINDKNKVVATQAYKLAKKILSGQDCFPVLFESQPLGETGLRDDTLMKLVGQACAYLYAYNLRESKHTFKPQHVYALFLPAVQELEPDSGTPSWEYSAWSKILRCWAREEAKAKVEIKKREEAADEVEHKVESMLEGAQLWAPSLADQSRSPALAMLSRILIAGSPSGHFYIMGPDGYYRPQAVRQSHLRAVIREMGLDELIQFQRFENGRVVKLTPEDILLEHGTVVTGVMGRVAVDGAFIEKLGTADAKMIVPLFRRRTDIQAKFDERVDKWLKHLVESPDDYLRLCKWLAYSLDFEGGPICALSISGPPSVGKKLLARGLSETVNTATAASGFDMVQNFNTMLGRTPFLVVDEGLPSRVPGGLDIADKFRQIVSGETIIINEKYQAPVTVNNPMRVLFTANNHAVIQQLTKHRDLSPDDQQAIGIRIMHFDAQHKAAAYLACPDSGQPDFGGLAFTRGWIAGDAGQPSDFVVARHLLHLYEHRADYGPPESRLLVEGNAESDVVQEMATSSGIAPDVIETVICIIEDQRGNFDGLSFDLDHGEVFITTAAILNYYRSDLVASRRMLDNNKIAGVLKSLSHRNSDNATWRTACTGNKRRYRWWRLDVMRLYKFAVEAGMKHEKLEALMRARFGDRVADALAEHGNIAELVRKAASE